MSAAQDFFNLWRAGLTPQEEAESTAIRAVVEHTDPDVILTAMILLLIQRGASDYVHRAVGCTPEGHAMIFEWCVAGVRFLYKMGLSQELFDSAQQLVERTNEAARDAG